MSVIFGAGFNAVRSAGTRGVVNLSRMQATKAGNILNGRYVVAGDNTAIDNGRLVRVVELETGENLVYEVTTPNATANKVLLVASVEVQYDEVSRAIGLDDFQNAAGDVIRLYTFYNNDELEVSYNNIDLIAAAPVVGNFIACQDGSTRWAEYDVGTLPADAIAVGQIEQLKVFGTRQIPMVCARMIVTP